MRNLVITRFMAAIVCLAVLNLTQPILAQKDDDEPGVKVIKTQRLSKSVIAKKLEKSDQQDDDVKALVGNLESEGYKAQTKETNYFGTETIYQRTKDKKTANVKFFVQDYSKAGSKDLAAIATVTITVGENSATYSFSLIAPEGKFENYIERKVDKQSRTVTRANSLWSCFKNRVKSKCGTVCISALVTCSGSWVAYLGCVIATCGVCATKAFGCCACDCSWWCKWAVGCCDR